MDGGPFEASGDRAEIAAGWVERLTRGAAGEADIAALRSWVAADPRNRQAYEAARAAWMTLPASRLRRRQQRITSIGWGGALAASIAALIFFMPASHDYETAAGEVTEFRLADGTIAWLDGDSAIDVDMAGSRRIVTLASGRAAFKVAEAGRPFAVQVGDATVTDIGTEFLVDRAGPLRVAVQEGEVEVAKDGARKRLVAGEGAEFAGNKVSSLNGAVSQFAWREGRILFDNVPLDQALRELDRYYPGSIELRDDALAARRVSGTLFMANPEESLQTIARSQNLKVTRVLWITRVSPNSQ